MSGNILDKCCFRAVDRHLEIIWINVVSESLIGVWKSVG